MKINGRNSHGYHPLFSVKRDNFTSDRVYTPVGRPKTGQVPSKKSILKKSSMTAIGSYTQNNFKKNASFASDKSYNIENSQAVQISQSIPQNRKPLSQQRTRRSVDNFDSNLENRIVSCYFHRKNRTKSKHKKQISFRRDYEDSYCYSGFVNKRYKGKVVLKPKLNTGRNTVILREKAQNSMVTLHMDGKIALNKHKYGPRSKNIIKLGQLHKNQNLGEKDLAKIISEMRQKIKTNEEIIRLKQLKLDPEILEQIRAYGYKNEDIDRDLRSLNTPVCNLYKLLEVEKRRSIEAELERSEGDFAKSVDRREPKPSEREVSEEPTPGPQSTLDRMTQVFYKFKNDPDYKPRSRKIRYHNKKTQPRLSLHKSVSELPQKRF
ncbi:unnamed protein product [Moneuplotes crassus]|uniref:Uncharacterized protein n=1 Tax=Euplotes crassus TaxID=5936 RepID=A0AAD1XCN1_EUPCR|nr:unnamed protein product [Moneuplotes crassus]